MDYATVPDTAMPSADYTAVSGTLTIPADVERATISVPLVEGGTGSGDSFTLKLSNPVAATIVAPTVDLVTFVNDPFNDSARGTIREGGLPVTNPDMLSNSCGDASVRGTVRHVFDVAQTNFDRWHHVFVDVQLSCSNTLSSAERHPTSMKVLYGPTGEHRSRQCITRPSAYRNRTDAVPNEGGCETLPLPYGSDEPFGGYSSHVLWVPDSDIGKAHQMLAWIDLDRDGVDDPGEPYHIFASDFANRTLSSSGVYGYELPSDFEARLLPGSTRVGRAGQMSELRLRLVDPIADETSSNVGLPASERAGRPLPNLPIGAFVATGPSSLQSVQCFNTPVLPAHTLGGTAGCTTDSSGEVILRYMVPAEAVNLFRQQQDDLWLYVDRNHNGRYDGGSDHSAPDPARVAQLPIAKAVNYIALGDSYSAGENGESPASGAYQAGVSPADAECRRWDQAYPVVFANEVLGNAELNIDITFATFACVGAITHNIYDPADPNGVVTDRQDTNRPSHTAVLIGHGVDPRWEPRQAVSLEDVEAELEENMRNVDLITLTIGGNDAGFADVLASCVKPILAELDLACDESDLDPGYDQVGDRVAAVVTRLRGVASAASIFVLGYPYVTPSVGACQGPEVEYVAGSEIGILVHESDECEALFDFIDKCDALSARRLLSNSGRGCSRWCGWVWENRGYAGY